jgi:cellulose synthase/poly-beta-1,6-N-acetylglucosamine synthase-like glycosyltransferase
LSASRLAVAWFLALVSASCYNPADPAHGWPLDGLLGDARPGVLTGGGVEAVSIVVPVHNGADTLGHCLSALSNQAVTAPVGDVSVIVVDDGSIDGSAQVAQQYGVTVIRQEHAGAAAARNRGLQEAQGSTILFTDADCEPLADWIDQMLAPLSEPDVVGVKGSYLTRQRSLVARFAQAEYEEKYDRLARQNRIDFVDTYAAAYRRDVLLAMGGFDPTFLLDEDQELSFRLASAGHRLAFARQAAVYHQHPSTLWTYFCRKLGLGRWKVKVVARYPRKALHDSYTPLSQKAQMVLLPLTLVAVLLAGLGLLSWTVTAVLVLSFLVTSAPLLVKAYHQGWPVVLVAPWLALLRALALDLGILWGVVTPPRMSL